jgi:hypothetical protein
LTEGVDVNEEEEQSLLTDATLTFKSEREGLIENSSIEFCGSILPSKRASSSRTPIMSGQGVDSASKFTTDLLIGVDPIIDLSEIFPGLDFFEIKF